MKTYHVKAVAKKNVATFVTMVDSDLKGFLKNWKDFDMKHVTTIVYSADTKMIESVGGYKNGKPFTCYARKEY